MAPHDNIETVIDALRRLACKTRQLTGARLIDRLVRDTGLDAASIRLHLRSIRAKGWIAANAWSGTGAPVGYVRVSLPPLPAPPWTQSWNDALLACPKLSDADRDSLRECGAQLADMDAAEFPRILNGLARLREDQAALAGMPAYLVSARYLCGSSKMLQKLGSRHLREFGIDLAQFAGHPAYVITGGASDPSAVVLVENPTAFELAVKTPAAKRCAFVATFGFGLSKASDDFGNQLASIVERGLSETVTVVREGSATPPLRELLSHPCITFWGDLDIAGMQIYERLAGRISGLALSALYKPMIRAITTTDQRHPYVNAVGKAGQMPYVSSREYVARMLTYCAAWAVDQELVNEDHIDELAGQPW